MRSEDRALNFRRGRSSRPSPRRSSPPPPESAADSYAAAREFEVELGGETIRVVSKRGLDHWDQVSPAANLLAGELTTADWRRILVLGCGHGAIGALLARRYPESRILLTDPSIVAVEMTRRTLAANGLSNAAVSTEISVLPAGEETFDCVVMELPKGRQLCRRWILEAHGALKHGGSFYIAGPNDEGIQSIVKDAAAVFGDAAEVRYRDRSRTARFIRSVGAPEDTSIWPAWASDPGIVPGTWYEFQAEVLGESFRIRSLPGVFSYDRVDDGSRLLLSALRISPGSRVLDLGCGYGLIGMMASRRGAGAVDLVDASLLAVVSSLETTRLNGMDHLHCSAGDVLSQAEGKYRSIVSNPPFHSGKSVDYQIAEAFIAQSRRCLESGGDLTLVCNKFIRYDIPMRQTFGHAEIIAEDTRYHVLRAARR